MKAHEIAFSRAKPDPFSVCQWQCAALQEREEQEDEEQHNDGAERSKSDERTLLARLVIAEMLKVLEEQGTDGTTGCRYRAAVCRE